MEISQYLSELSETSPCGDYLEYDPDYLEMERLSKGSPETQYGETVTAAEEGNWQKVKEQALSLLERTRDIYVAVFLAMSEAKMANLSGLSTSLTLIAGLLDKFWDNVHPAQDPEDSYPILRMNALSSLNDYEQFLKPIRKIFLTTSKTFPISFRDYEIATGKIPSVDNEDAEKLNEEWIVASFRDNSPESLIRNIQLLESLQNNVEDISRITIDKVGAAAAPDLSNLKHLFKDMQQVFTKYSHYTKQNEPIDLPPPSTEENDVHAPNPTTQNEHGGIEMPGISSITSREQVSEAIDLMCGYFEINEPASPIPLLLRRAQNLLDKDFIETLQELAPDGITQAVNVCGIKDTEQE